MASPTPQELKFTKHVTRYEKSLTKTPEPWICGRYYPPAANPRLQSYRLTDRSGSRISGLPVGRVYVCD